ncbi:uncharacterized mitochondrial protein AtMg00810-like [Setaria viridis]|uniref:uncharacterized mitochondrial protein AtMg00810-like n=1 Tax=Setaria viridis TaxID=4556 RepID=UPI003B3A19E3
MDFGETFTPVFKLVTICSILTIVASKKTSSGFFLYQAQYVDDILEPTGMSNCKAVATPANTKPKQSTANEKLINTSNVSFYRNMAGTKPVLCYIKGTPSIGIQLHAMASATLTAYSKADWAGCSNMRRSLCQK